MPHEDPAARNVEDISRLEHEVAERISTGERVAKAVTDTVGTPLSAFLHLAVFAADEFLFGPLGIQLQLGYYVGRDFNRYVGGDTYTKLGLRGYLPPFWSGGPRLHAGIGLKAHGFSAEYIAGQVGLAF